jgi:hypothetical protein
MEIDGEAPDYILTEDHAWITVKGFSVKIRKTDEGIAVDVYVNGKEDEGPISSAYGLDVEADVRELA